MAGANQLTRAEMEAVIKGGGTVEHKGRFYSTVESLPSAGELEGVDGLEREAAEQEAALKATREKLAAAKKSAADAEKAEAERKKADEADDEKATAKKSGGK